jgi:hypothetical protein
MSTTDHSGRTALLARRRTFLRLALAGAVGVPLSACGGEARSGGSARVLVAYLRRNVREQEADARPGIANPLASIDCYDAVVLASPIWNVRAPMIMSTFTERHDFSGTTVHPVTTHAMSGLGTTREDYARSCRGARIGAGLAVRGEQAGSAGAEVDAWLRTAGLRSWQAPHP